MFQGLPGTNAVTISVPGLGEDGFVLDLKRSSSNDMVGEY